MRSAAATSQSPHAPCATAPTCAPKSTPKGPEGYAPDLGVAAAYPPADFRRLMRTGVALGGRRLGVMGVWARTELAFMTDEEIDALRAYLGSLSGRTDKAAG